MDRGVWWATLLGVAKSRTWLSTHYIFSISISNAILLCYHWNDLTFFFFWRDLVFIQSGMRASQMELAVKNLPADAGDIRDASSIPGSWRSPGRGHGNPFQYSCLENPMNRVRHDLAHTHVVYQVAQVVKNSQPMQEEQETWFQFLDWENPLEKKMATHSSILAWKIPWTEEPGGLLSKGSQGVRLNWATNHMLFTG